MNPRFFQLQNKLLSDYDEDHDTAPNLPNVTWADKQLLDMLRILAAEIQALQNANDITNGGRVISEPHFDMDNQLCGWSGIVLNAQNERIGETGVYAGTEDEIEIRALQDAFLLLCQMQQQEKV